MFESKIKTKLIVAVLGAVVTASGVGNAASASRTDSPAVLVSAEQPNGELSESSATPSFSALATRATTMARTVFKKPQLVEVRGMTDGEATVARWQFIFNDDPGVNRESVVIEISADGKIAPPDVHPSVRVGSRVLSSADIGKLSPSTACELVRTSGYTDEIGYVVLRRPLGPVKENPQYFFTDPAGHHFAAVDTITRHVRAL